TTSTHTLSLHDALPISFSPNGRMLASGGEDGTLRIWRTAGKELVAAQRQLLPAPNAPTSDLPVESTFQRARARFHMAQLHRDARSEEHTSELQSRFDLV